MTNADQHAPDDEDAIDYGGASSESDAKLDLRWVLSAVSVSRIFCQKQSGFTDQVNFYLGVDRQRRERDRNSRSVNKIRVFTTQKDAAVVAELQDQDPARKSRVSCRFRCSRRRNRHLRRRAHVDRRWSQPRPYQMRSSRENRQPADLSFQIGRRCHAACGGANRGNRPVLAAMLELQKCRSQIANAGHAVRVAQRDCATLHIGGFPRRL